MQKKKVIILKGERFLYFMIGFLILGNILGPAFFSALLSKTNIEVESLRSKIQAQENRNESLTMKINELASLNNIEEVAALYGLEYNNTNVEVIE